MHIFIELIFVMEHHGRYFRRGKYDEKEGQLTNTFLLFVILCESGVIAGKDEKSK